MLSNVSKLWQILNMEYFKLTQLISLIENVIRYQYNLICMFHQKLTQNLHTSKMGVRMVEKQW